MKLKLQLLFVLLAFSGSLLAQDIPFTDLPPNPEDGKCYAKCKMPDRYETVQVQKLKKAGTTKVEKAKPQYKTVTERIMVKEASVKYVYRPATYKTVDKQVLVKEGYCMKKVVPAKYTHKQTGKTLVAGETGRWVRKKKSPNCFSENPEDCFVMCWETVPAQYKYDTEKILVSEEKVEYEEVAAQYKTIKIQVIDEPARYEQVEIPAVYKNFTSRVKVNSDCFEDKTVTTPDQYTLVSEKRLVSSGGYTGWVEILCESRTTDNVVKQVQRQLNNKGYNVGTVDGIMGIKTRAMLEQYQRENGLPIGNLNLQTLRALGINEQ